MYTFRGFDTTLEKFVYGISIDQTNFSTRILDKISNKWSYVIPETVGRKIILKDSKSTEVYQGDILRYSFQHGEEYYHKYYRILEDSTEAWAEEIWRDYELDCETFEISRFHNTKYAGTRKSIPEFNTIKPWVVVGNIWQNPELL